MPIVVRTVIAIHARCFFHILPSGRCGDSVEQARAIGHTLLSLTYRGANVPDIIPAQRVAWMELFYDVIVAASMLLIYGSLAKHLSWQEFIWLSAIALVVFAMWLSTTLVFNRLPGDTTGRRLFVIAQMFALVVSVASMENGDRVDGDVGIIALWVAMLILAAMWDFIRRSAAEQSQTDRLPVLAFLIGSVFLLSTALLPDSWNAAVFCVGALIPGFRRGAVLVGLGTRRADDERDCRGNKPRCPAADRRCIAPIGALSDVSHRALRPERQLSRYAFARSSITI